MADQATFFASPPANLHVCRVIAVRHYTDTLFAFSCERPAALRFRSGEFVMIGLMAGDRALLRAYSIASPSWDETLTFYSIKAPGGPLTGRLQHIAAGDAVLIGRKPTGTLVLDALSPGRRLVLVSTGTGIAPFASLIREPETYERFGQVVLTHTCRTDRELEFGREAVSAAFACPLVGEEAQRRLVHLTTLTREPHGLEGRITGLVADNSVFARNGMAALDPGDDRVMICGSAPMLHDMKALVQAGGFREGSNHQPGSFVIERAFAS